MTTAELIQVDTDKVHTIDEIVDECGIIKSSLERGVMAGLRMAAGIVKLRAMLSDEMMTEIMALQGTALGFLTDKDRERNKDGVYGYPVEIVKDCVIEALLRGARVVGNEFNIIAGRCYLTKNYFKRVLSELPGLTDLVIEFGVPVESRGNSLVPAKATWKYNGKAMSMVCDVLHNAEGQIISDGRIPVRVNNGSIVDAVLGKAERKMRARIMERITNTTFSDGDASDIYDVIGEQEKPSSSSLKEKIRLTAPTSNLSQETAAPRNVDYNPLQNEDAKSYHQRLVKEIDMANSQEELGAIQKAVNEAEESKFLNTLRAGDLNKRIDARFDQLTAK